MHVPKDLDLHTISNWIFSQLHWVLPSFSQTPEALGLHASPQQWSWHLLLHGLCLSRHPDCTLSERIQHDETEFMEPAHISPNGVSHRSTGYGWATGNWTTNPPCASQSCGRCAHQSAVGGHAAPSAVPSATRTCLRFLEEGRIIKHSGRTPATRLDSDGNTQCLIPTQTPQNGSL